MNFKSSLAMMLGLGLWAGTVRAQSQTAPYLLLSSARPSPVRAVAPDNPNSSCGKMALAELARLLKGDTFDARSILQTPAPPEGFSLEQLAELADANGLGLTAVKWNGEGELPAPSLIHWSRGHYAVLVAQDGRGCRLLDTLWGPRWAGLDEIKGQASGNFLIPKEWLKTRVSSYTPLSSGEAGFIQGRVSITHYFGTNSSPNPDSDGSCTGGPNGGGGGPNGSPNTSTPSAAAGSAPCASCGGGDSTPGATGRHQQCPDCEGKEGMAYWRVSEPYLNWWIYDKPLGYQPALGGRVSFQLTYNERKSEDTFPPFGLGPGWNCSWITYIDQVDGGRARLFVAGGGDRTYVNNQYDFYDQTFLLRQTNGQTDTIVSVYRNYPDLVSTYGVGENLVYNLTFVTNNVADNLAGYVLYRPDGTTQVFSQLETNGGGGGVAFLRAYLTQEVLPDGTYNQFVYGRVSGGVVVLKQMIDTDGQTNTLSYTNTALPWLITSVTDRFGRAANFQYNSGGYLTIIIDPENISSGFGYSPTTNAYTTNWITSMTTPYGTTTFQPEEHSASNEIGRASCRERV